MYEHTEEAELEGGLAMVLVEQPPREGDLERVHNTADQACRSMLEAAEAAHRLEVLEEGKGPWGRVQVLQAGGADEAFAAGRLEGPWHYVLEPL